MAARKSKAGRARTERDDAAVKAAQEFHKHGFW